MLLQVMALFACLFATVLQFAVYRSPDCVDSHMTRMARRIVIAGMFLAVIYAANALYMSAPANTAFLILALVGMSQGIFAASCLLPHLERAIPWSRSHLNNLR
jgi:hypothetical protein